MEKVTTEVLSAVAGGDCPDCCGHVFGMEQKCREKDGLMDDTIDEVTRLDEDKEDEEDGDDYDETDGERD